MQSAHIAQGIEISAKPASLWHEDIGPVLWWHFPIAEPPYAGTPLDDTWPDGDNNYYTHWTDIVTPKEGPDRCASVDVGGGAHMTVPRPDWLYQLRYTRPEPYRGAHICDDRMVAAGALESYLYLVMSCTKAEAWRRIKAMRAALAPSHR